MKISVIVPTYRPKEYIDECLSSLARQDMPKCEWELIVVLNGPRNPYFDHINTLLDGSGITYCLLYTEDRGVSNARNAGLDKAVGEYIAFVDDDDYVSPTYLSELYAAAKPSCVSHSAVFAFYDGTGKEDGKYFITTEYRRLTTKHVVTHKSLVDVRRCLNSPWVKLFHRDIIGDRRFDTTITNGEDSLFVASLTDRIKGMCFTSPSAIYYRRKRADSAESNNSSACFRVRNGVLLLVKFTRMYLAHPKAYSAAFFLSRLLAVIKTMLFFQQSHD